MDGYRPKCHPVMRSGQRYTVRTAPAGTCDAHWRVFYPTAIWTTPVSFVHTDVHDLHPNKKFQCCQVLFSLYQSNHAEARIYCCTKAMRKILNYTSQLLG